MRSNDCGEGETDPGGLCAEFAAPVASRRRRAGCGPARVEVPASVMSQAFCGVPPVVDRPVQDATCPGCVRWVYKISVSRLPAVLCQTLHLSVARTHSVG